MPHVGRPNNNPSRMEPRSVPVEKDKARINDERKVKPHSPGEPPMGVRPNHPGAQKEPKAPSDKLKKDYIQARDVPMQTMTEAEIAEWNLMDLFRGGNRNRPSFVPGFSVAYDIHGDGIDLYLLRDGKQLATKRVDSHRVVTDQIHDLENQIAKLRQSRMGMNINPRKMATKAAMDFANQYGVQPAKVGQLGKDISARSINADGAGAAPAQGPFTSGTMSQAPSRGHPLRAQMGMSAPSSANITPPSGGGHPLRAQMGMQRGKPGHSFRRQMASIIPEPEQEQEPEAPPMGAGAGEKPRVRVRQNREVGTEQQDQLLKKLGYSDMDLVQMDRQQKEDAIRSGMPKNTRGGRGMKEGYPDKSFERTEPAHSSRIGDLGWKGSQKISKPPADKLKTGYVQAREVSVERIHENAEQEMDDLIEQTLRRMNIDLAEEMQGPQAETITLPANWASALVNDDFSGLDDEESDQCQMMMHELAQHGYQVVDAAGEPYYTNNYQTHNPHSQYRGGEVMDYIVHKAPSRQPQEHTGRADMRGPEAWAGGPPSNANVHEGKNAAAPVSETKLPRTRTRWI